MWVPVGKGEDLPPGTRFRMVYEIKVPEWLGWVPAQILDWIVAGGMTVWAEVQRLYSNDAYWERYEVKVVEPGKTYELWMYGVAKGMPAWAIALGIGALLGAVFVWFLINLKSVDKWSWALFFLAVSAGVALTGYGVYKIASALRGG